MQKTHYLIFLILFFIFNISNKDIYSANTEDKENNNNIQRNDFNFEKNKLFLLIEKNLGKDRHNVVQKLLDDFKVKYPDSEERKYYYYSALVNEHRGEFLSAIKNYQKAISLYPQYSQARNNLGCLYLKLEKYAESEDQFLKAIEANPYSPFIHYNLGNLYFQTAKYNEAEKYLLTACKYKANYGEAYDKLGLIMYKTNNYSGAVDYYKKAIEFNSASAESYYYLGLSFYRLGQTNKAIYNLSKSVNVKKDFYAGFFELGKIHKIYKEYKEAIKYFLIAESINFEDTAPRISIAECYYEMKRYEDAVGALKIILERDKDNKEITGLLAKIRKDQAFTGN